MSATWPSRYVGIPFDDRNSDGAAHCWGLVRRVYQAELGIDLPAYGELSAMDMIAMARAVGTETGKGGLWVAVPKSQEHEFDVAIMFGWIDDGAGGRRRAPVHVGVICPNRCVLHVERATAAVCVPLTHHTIRFRHACSYRHRELIARS